MTSYSTRLVQKWSITDYYSHSRPIHINVPLQWITLDQKLSPPTCSYCLGLTPTYEHYVLNHEFGQEFFLPSQEHVSNELSISFDDNDRYKNLCMKVRKTGRRSKGQCKWLMSRPKMTFFVLIIMIGALEWCIMYYFWGVKNLIHSQTEWI